LQGRPSADEALDRKVAEHVLAVLARKRATLPLTAGFMQACAAQGFNHRVGQKRAARMCAHLRQAGLLTPYSRYRGRHGFWVTIYRVIHRVAPGSFSVRRKSRVKYDERKNWWKHALFGTPDGKPPPS
jgi:hypothetical protein